MKAYKWEDGESKGGIVLWVRNIFYLIRLVAFSRGSKSVTGQFSGSFSSFQFSHLSPCAFFFFPNGSC